MSTEITPNAPLLLKTLEHIENHPEELRQEVWHCGTAGCFAGHAGIIDGGQWVSSNNFMLARDDDPQDLTTTFAGNVIIHIEDRARHALGLTREQAQRLFDGGNTINDLRAEVYRLTGDWDRFAEHAERMLAKSINGEFVMPSAYADPAVTLETKHLLWQDARDALIEWHKALDGDVDLGTLEPQWRDAEVYTNHLRGFVDEAVNKLIGRAKR